MNQNNQYGYGRDQRGPYSTPDQRPYGQVPPEHFRQQGGPVRELPKPKRPRRGRAIVLAALFCALGVIAFGSCTALMFDGATSASKTDSSPQVQPTKSEPGPAVPSPTKPRTKKVAPVTVPRDGVLFVGKDVKPGTYRTTVPADSLACYAARLKDTDGGINSIISNNLYEPGAQAVLTVKRTDYAIEVRCDGARWELVK
jgi:hypothetical protein